MSDAKTPPPGVDAAEWEQTPQRMRLLVLALQQQVVTLSERVSELEERSRRSSRNSSQPPSTDAPSAPERPKRQRSSRKQGAQPGHQGHGRTLLPPAQVDHVVEATPRACGQCGHLLLGADPQPTRHQVTDLPRVRPQVTE